MMTVTVRPESVSTGRSAWCSKRGSMCRSPLRQRRPQLHAVQDRRVAAGLSSECAMPGPAVIRLSRPGVISCWLPTLSRCSTSPSTSQLTVCRPVCGCGGTCMPGGPADVRRPVVVDEAPGADHPPVPVGQGPGHRHRARSAERHRMPELQLPHRFRRRPRPGRRRASPAGCVRDCSSAGGYAGAPDAACRPNPPHTTAGTTRRAADVLDGVVHASAHGNAADHAATSWYPRRLRSRTAME